MSPRATSLVSALVAAAVPAADAAFGWHLQTDVVVGITAGLLGVAGVELGHAHVAATKGVHESMLQRFEHVLGGVAEMVGELHAHKAAAPAPAPAPTPVPTPASAPAPAATAASTPPADKASS